jgi:hypothetical protein
VRAVLWKKQFSHKEGNVFRRESSKHPCHRFSAPDGLGEIMDERERIIATRYGLRHQLEKTQEELRELNTAILKHLAGPTPKTREAVIEEVIDCEVLFEQLKYLLSVGDREANLYKDFKINRQLARIGEWEKIPKGGDDVGQ